MGITLLIVLTGVTLLPTLILSPEKLFKQNLLTKFSEEFREYYGYTKKEWYEDH